MENKKAIVKVLEKIIEGTEQARRFYLKTDLKVRLKLLVEENHGFDEFVNLWKRLNIIKKDFGDSSQTIIDEAVQELAEILKKHDIWAKNANMKLKKLLDFKDEDILIIGR